MDRSALFCTHCHTVATPLLAADQAAAKRSHGSWTAFWVIAGVILLILLFLGAMGLLPVWMSNLNGSGPKSGDKAVASAASGCLGGCIGTCGGIVGLLFLAVMVVVGIIFFAMGVGTSTSTRTLARCPKCGSTALVPIDSPRAKAHLQGPGLGSKAD
jgi:hypothetical protein